MADEKKFSPKEVATLILSKVGEILKKSELNKSVLKLQADPQEHVAGVHTSFGEEGKSFAGANVRASQDTLIEQKSKKFAEKAKEEHKEKLNELKSMPKPNLPKSEEIQKSEHLDKKESEDRYYVDTKKRDKDGRVTIYDKERDIEFKAKLKEESDIEKGEIKKEENCSSCGQMHKKETKFDRCVEHVKEQSPKVKSPEAVCVSQGVKPEKWNKNEALEKAKVDEITEQKRKESGWDPKDIASIKHLERQKRKDEVKKAEKEQQIEESDKAFDIKEEDSKSSNDPRLSEQVSPEKNSKEQAEGNNELAGTTPTQVGKDGKNKPGFSEMRSDLKLAKWLGRMEEKRKVKKSENIEKSEILEKAKLDEGKSIKEKQEARENRHWRAPSWSTKNPKADLPSEVETFMSLKRDIKGKPEAHRDPSTEKIVHAVKGVHKQSHLEPGRSVAGAAATEPHYGEEQGRPDSKEIHRKVLSEIKQMPSPNLKSEDLEKTLDKEKRLKDLKDAHSRIKIEKVKEGIKQLEHETKGAEASHQKGVHTKPGAYISHTERGSKVSPIQQHAESQKVREELSQTKFPMNKTERDVKIRELQKSGLSPIQIENKISGKS